MSSQALRDARKYEEEKEREITPEERPAYHLSARVGWMNDPNGFSYYQGKYHLFYQYHPYSSVWGPMHWAHAVTENFLQWEVLPAAMAPDMSYDRDGCFSGNAVVLPDGRQLLMYTSVVNEEHEGRTVGVQTQSLAIGDGMEYEKYAHNPVLDKRQLPKDSDRYDFRDPKVWRKKDGSYRALVANRNSRNKSGRLLLFGSEDGFKWRFLKVFIENNDHIGKMWECPDFFALNDQYVLLCSAMDMLPMGLEYMNGNGTFYMVGSYDEKTDSFTPEYDHAVDYGIDFYAPQTITTNDGRQVLIAWMQNWDTCNLHQKQVPWFGQMCIPRELSIENGRLYQKPVREIASLHKDKVVHNDIRFENGEITLPGIKGRCIDLTVRVKSSEADDVYQKFALRFAQNGTYHTAVSVRPKENLIKLDRAYSGSRRAIIHQRRTDIDCADGGVEIRLLLDRFSAEIFFNDGEKVMTTTIDTDVSADEVSFYVDGAAVISVEKYGIER